MNQLMFFILSAYSESSLEIQKKTEILLKILLLVILFATPLAIIMLFSAAFVVGSLIILLIICSLFILWLLKVGNYKGAVNAFLILFSILFFCCIKFDQYVVVREIYAYGVLGLFLLMTSCLVGYDIKQPLMVTIFNTAGVLFLVFVDIMPENDWHFLPVHYQTISVSIILITISGGIGILSLRLLQDLINNINEVNQNLKLEIIQHKKAQKSLNEEKIKAEDANIAKSDFLAKMSHEIRTPMNAVLGISELLIDTELKNEHKRLVKDIHSSGKNLLAIINDILDLSKIESNHLDLEKIDFNFYEVLQTTCKHLSHICAEKDIYLSHHYQQNLPHYLVGDSDRIRQILMNVIGNAIKFTDEGEILVEVNGIIIDNKAHLKLTAKDSGIGMSESQKEKIFEKFHQTDNSATRKYGGTGLGLTITKQIVNLMEGEISVHSEVGVGSIFVIELILPVGQKKIKNETAPLVSIKQYNKSILLVEDNLVNRTLAIKMLQKFGCTIDTAENGEVAVDKTRNNKYDIIFMDCQMPVMNGYTAASEIRRLEKNNQKPNLIIALTANAMKGDKEKCLASGMDDFLSKPISKKLLGNMLEKYIHCH